MRSPSTAAAVLFAFVMLTNATLAGECPGNPDALGTSRVMTVDAGEYKRIGTIQFHDSLPLEDHEVILTFDDGPIAPHTGHVLDALAAQCVKATFFVVGQQARAHPEALQRAYKEGHTIGTHSEHHARLDRLALEPAEREITVGIDSVAQALGDKSAVAPFFRFPYLDETGLVDNYALEIGLSIWSADLHGSDWRRITPEQIVAIVMERLERKKKGIILLHDIHERTASALPIMLRELKKRGYRVVHAVPGDSHAVPGESLRKAAAHRGARSTN